MNEQINQEIKPQKVGFLEIGSDQFIHRKIRKSNTNAILSRKLGRSIYFKKYFDINFRKKSEFYIKKGKNI